MRQAVLILAAIAICTALNPSAVAQTYRPSNYTDQGIVPTANPTNAYDANTGTFAELAGQYLDGEDNRALCIWNGFPSHTSSSPLTLNIKLAVPFVNHGTAVVSVSDSAGGLANFTYTSVQSTTTVQVTVPAGINLDSLGIKGQAFGSPFFSGSSKLDIYEIWVQ